MIKNTELIIINNRVYHLNINSHHIANDIILVGDPSRVNEVSKYFDKITHKIYHREFITHTGNYRNKEISVVSTGIGCDNIDIVINEIDAAVNIDLKTRRIKRKKRKLNFIRLGTSGSIQKDIALDSFITSKYALGFDGLPYFHKTQKCIDKSITHAFNQHASWPEKLSKPYIIKASNKLLSKFKNLPQGITATSTGFYSPQGRTLRLKSSIPNMHKILSTFKYNNNIITNFEMESSALYFLGQSLGHSTITICAIMGNRPLKTQSENYSTTMQTLIKEVLNKI